MREQRPTLREDGDEPDIDTEEARQNLETLFPNLSKNGYKITSGRDDSHNCVAYAVGDKRRKWAGRWLAKIAGYYWPPEAKPGTGVDELIYAYEAIGFTRCENQGLEPGYEKIAVYQSEDGGWGHASKLLENGLWSSKIGEIEDISHRTPHAFSGNKDYGFVYCFMKRPSKFSADQNDEISEIEAFE